MKKLCWLLVALLCLLCTTAMASETACTHPSGTPVNIDDDMMHGLKCNDCGEVYDAQMHNGSGTYVDENTCSFSCADCGYTSTSHVGGLGASGEGYHGTFCMHCDSFYGETEYCYEDCTDQDGECDVCGDTKLTVYHDDYALTCTPNGDTHIVTCGACGEVAYEWPLLYMQADQLMHMEGCRACLYITGNGWEQKMHTGMGSGTYIDEETCSFSCADCGFTHNGGHVVAMGCGDGFHGTSCYFCDQWTWKETCYEECADQDGECDVCGAPVVEIWHAYPVYTPNGDGTHTAVCGECGGDEYTEKCSAYCYRPGVCAGCGGEASGHGGHLAPESEIVTVSISDTQHRTYCPRCKDVANYVSAHSLEVTDNGDGTHTAVCTECDYTAVQAHELELEPGDEENHIYQCAACDYSKAEAHDLGDEAYQHNADVHYIPCLICDAHLWESSHANACGKPGECLICGGAYTSEIIRHLFYLDQVEYDNEGHWYPCIGCGEPQAYEAHFYADESAKECQECGRPRECQHSYWYTYSPRPTCTEEGVKVVKCKYCDKIQSTTTVPAKGHTLTTEDKGEYILESCEQCDYEVQLPKEEAPENAPEKAELLVDMLEDEASVKVELPEGKAVKNLFTVKAAEDAQVSGKVTVVLNFTEEELAALENAELVLVQENGTTVALTYEVKDGKVVFETEALGTFAFVG